MDVERLEKIKGCLVAALEMEVMNMEEVDAKELGEVIDMVKDIDEAIYYCTVTKAMKEYGDEPEAQQYYPWPKGEKMYYRARDGRGRFVSSPRNTGSRAYTEGMEYYNGDGNSSSYSSTSGMGGNARNYSEHDQMKDWREGRSPQSRRMYMEAKEMKHDKATQMRELEKYMQELTQDIVEMIEDASAEEKQYLSKKISALSTKISAVNG